MEYRYIKMKRIANVILGISIVLFMACAVVSNFLEEDTGYTSTLMGAIAFTPMIGIFVSILMKIHANSNIKRIQSMQKSKAIPPPTPTLNIVPIPRIEINNNHNHNVNRTKQVYINAIPIHEDIKDLIFYTNCQLGFNLNDASVTADPSYIDEFLAVVEYKYKVTVEKLGYYPSYKGMTSIQRGCYLKYLENPYDTSYEIGYVFTLFYGLEHQLMYGNKSKAAYVINKLRQCHDNTSFQRYSFDALVYFFDGRNELANFLEYEYENLDFYYSVYLHLITDLIYPSHYLIKHKKRFGLTKYAYIDRDPVLFQYELNNQLAQKYDIPGVPLDAYYSMEKLPMPYVSFPANTTLNVLYSDRFRLMRSVVQNDSVHQPFIDDMKVILNTTYDIVAETHKHTPRKQSR